MSSAVSIDEEIEDWNRRKEERRLHIFKMRGNLDKAEEHWKYFVDRVDAGEINLVDKMFECNNRCVELRELVKELEQQYMAIYGEKI